MAERDPESESAETDSPPPRRDTKLDPDSVRTARDFLLTDRRARWDESPHESVARRIAALREAKERGPYANLPAPAPTPEPDASPPGEPGQPPPAPEIVLSATGVRRAGTGWRASCVHRRGVDSRYVADTRYGGYVGAFLHALEIRDGFYRERRLPIPWEAAAVVDGRAAATELERDGERILVRWNGEEHEVTGDDAEEVATELALDLFVELVSTLPGAPSVAR